MNEIGEAADGLPLLGGLIVYKFALTAHVEGNKPTPKMFALSGAEHKLSVWSEDLTPTEIGINFLTNKEKYDYILRFSVDSVRSIKLGDPPNERYPADVIWEFLTAEVNGETILDARPGANGHAGITGLHETHTPEKRERKSIRESLAFNADLISLSATVSYQVGFS